MQHLRKKNPFFSLEERIFSLERCIVKKKTYLCHVWLEKWLDIIRKRFLLYPDTEIANF